METADIRIEGGRIALRDPILDDLDVLAYWLQPDQQWQELDGPYTDLPGPDQQQAILQNWRSSVQSPGWPVPRTMLSIVSRDEGQMMGQVTWRIEPGETAVSPGLSIVIYKSDFWGYGLGYEALGLWIDYLFAADPSLTRLELRTWAGNRGMVRLAHKLGFEEVTPVRRRRGLRFLTHKPEGVGFSLARQSWNGRFGAGFAVTLEGGQ